MSGLQNPLSFTFHTSFYLIFYACTLPAFIVDLTSTFCALDFYVMSSGLFLQIFIFEFLNSIKDLTCLELHKLSFSWASIIRCLLSSFATICWVWLPNLVLRVFILMSSHQNPFPFIFRNSCISSYFLCTWCVFHGCSTCTLCALNFWLMQFVVFFFVSFIST